jgi:hypothetical protein
LSRERLVSFNFRVHACNLALDGALSSAT